MKLKQISLNLKRRKTAMLISVDNELRGVVAVADTVKDTAQQAIQNFMN